MVGLALLIQILIFPLFGAEALLQSANSILHLTSYFLLFIFGLLNWRVWQILMMGLGMSLNVMAIAGNGGYMPASVTALRNAGNHLAAQGLLDSGQLGNVTEMNSQTALNFLGDRFYLPAWIPLSTAFSLGDGIIGAGIFLLLALKMKGS